jgi:peptidoglycan/xylan/chitin deacetylase (PgdA/CDA1 family)
MSKAGLAITFDDNYIDDWYKCLKFFDTAHVKVTFYISGYDKLTDEQKIKLHVLQDHGNEIAYHSLNHPDFVKYMNSNSMGRLEHEEIIKGLEMMKKDGFHPTTFAYPFGSHNEVLDNCLLRRFKSIRFLNGTANYAKSYTTSSDNTELYAIGLDISSGKSTQELVQLVNMAKENNNCLVLVGHHIGRKDLQMQVPLSRLKAIVKAAKESGMEFYTASEISRK